jgi:hypothetical protein
LTLREWGGGGSDPVGAHDKKFKKLELLMLEGLVNGAQPGRVRPMLLARLAGGGGGQSLLKV